jgi:hypothetical protein
MQKDFLFLEKLAQCAICSAEEHVQPQVLTTFFEDW